jgi:oligopeptide transport system substrate-binding protein
MTLMLYEGLMRLDKEGKLALALAQSYSLSSDKKTYTFTLRDAKWSDGSPITAYDFEYSWKKILSPDFETPIKHDLYIFAGGKQASKGEIPFDDVGIRALDEKTLQVTLAYPAPYFLDMIASTPYFYPAKARIDEIEPKAFSSTKGIYSGPFILSRYRPGHSIRVEKNPHYWDAESVKLDAIEISCLSDMHTELALFERGELDWAGQPLSLGLPIDAIDQLQKEGLLKTAKPSKLYLYFFNVDTPPFNNVKMRKAFSLAINRGDIVRHVTQGGQQPALGFVPTIFAKHRGTYFKDNDVKEARRLFELGLKEMGKTRETLEPIKINAYSASIQEKVAQTVARQWEAAFGVPIKIETSEWSVHIDKLYNKDYQALCVNWFPSVRDPICFLEIFSPEREGIANWKDVSYSKLLDRSNHLQNTSERNATLVEAEQMLVDYMPAAPLYFNGANYLLNDRLKNVYVSEFGIVDFKCASFE